MGWKRARLGGKAKPLIDTKCHGYNRQQPAARPAGSARSVQRNPPGPGSEQAAAAGGERARATAGHPADQLAEAPTRRSLGGPTAPQPPGSG